MKERVCFFSVYDLSVGHNLELAEKAIDKYKNTAPSDMDDVVELYHIKELLDNDCRLKSWTDDYFNKLKDLVKGYNAIIVDFLKHLSVDQVELAYDTLEWEYRQTFWDIIGQYKLYDLIPSNVLKRIALRNNNDLRAILQCKLIVDKYKVIIKDILLNNDKSAHFIIDKYIAQRNNHSGRELYLPQNLTMEDKEFIINKYLNSDNPDLHYVRLICQNKDEQNKLILSPVVKAKANKLVEKLNNDLLKDERTFIVEQNVSVKFSNIDKIPLFSCKIENNNTLTYIYSIRFIKRCSHVQLITNCCCLFYWLNQHSLLELINKNNEVDALETVLFYISKNSYPTFSNFIRKNNLSLCQLSGYYDTLINMQTSVEQELKIFYENYLKDKYSYPSLNLNLPNVADSWLNKCRVLLPELDSVVKQYNTYIVYSKIDLDIIRYSKPLKVTDGKSLLINKYYEINNDNKEIERVLHYMFDSFCVVPGKDKYYHSLYDLLENEDFVFFDNFKNYQKRGIEVLVSYNILKKDADGRLSLYNKEQAIVLQSLWEYRACAYWHYGTDGRKALDEMFTKGWVIKNNNLLTTEERKYFSYYLDNSEYTNGPAYRNNYAHGSNPPKENETIHQTAYLTILRLLIILILKIEDDLWSTNRALSMGYSLSKK